MNKKILWFWLLLLQINFLVVWFRGEDSEFFLYSLIIGGAVSYGIAALLIYKIYTEKKNTDVKILPGILIFALAGLLGWFIYSSLIVLLLYSSLLIFLLILLFTSLFVFTKKVEEDRVEELS